MAKRHFHGWLWGVGAIATQHSWKIRVSAFPGSDLSHHEKMIYISHETKFVWYWSSDSFKMAPPESFEVQYPLLSKILAEKGLPLQRLSKTPRACGSSNSRLRAANSNILAATVKPPFKFWDQKKDPLNWGKK